MEVEEPPDPDELFGAAAVPLVAGDIAEVVPLTDPVDVEVEVVEVEDDGAPPDASLGSSCA